MFEIIPGAERENGFELAFAIITGLGGGITADGYFMNSKKI